MNNVKLFQIRIMTNNGEQNYLWADIVDKEAIEHTINLLDWALYCYVEEIVEINGYKITVIKDDEMHANNEIPKIFS